MFRDPTGGRPRTADARSWSYLNRNRPCLVADLIRRFASSTNRELIPRLSREFASSAKLSETGT